MMGQPRHLTRSSLLTGICLLLLSVSFAGAHTLPAPTQGTLFIARDDGGFVPMPLKQTSVNAVVLGFAAQVTVRQTFNNPFPDPLEAVYVFPLPESAAVSGMTIRVGDRTIKGVIKKREEARKTYEKAKREGKTAALLDQERPNIFTQSVANIEPGKEVFVEITYDVALKYENGSYEFVYPMVVGPRFIPGTPDGKPAVGGGSAPDTDRVKDASKITPPLLKPGQRSGRDISLQVTIDAGTGLHELDSPTHQIVVDTGKGPSAKRAVVSLARSNEIPNKDFVIRYRLAKKEPVFAVKTHRDRHGGYLSLNFEPPTQLKGADATPKEVYFVVDASGSMSGKPMAIVKKAMRHAIANLNPRDTFQIIRFSSSASSLSERPMANTRANLKRALEHINSLNGGGGTQMIEGIRAALKEGVDEGRLRIVCFMTDGYIGNEVEILREIGETLGDRTRLFAFGIGSSVNRYLLERMSSVGRGATQVILLNEDPEDQVRRFYERIRSPALTNIAIDWKGLSISEASPASMPDLFVGQPLRLFARFSGSKSARVVVSGDLAGKRVSYTLPVSTAKGAGTSPMVARLWARSRIKELSMEELKQRRVDLTAAITDLGLRYSLVTRYTSFVAVDSVSTNKSGHMRTYQVPVEVPDGVDYTRVVPTGRNYQQRVEVLKERGPSPAKPTSADAYDYEYDDDEDELVEGDLAIASISGPGASEGRWRLGLGFGIGPTNLGGDSNAGLLASFNAHVDRQVGSLSLGGEARLMVPLSEDEDMAAVLVRVVYEVNRYLRLLGGAGPVVWPELRVSFMTAMELVPDLPVPAGLQLRYEQISVGDEDDARSLTLGVELSF